MPPIYLLAARQVRLHIRCDNIEPTANVKVLPATIDMITMTTITNNNYHTYLRI